MRWLFILSILIVVGIFAYGVGRILGRTEGVEDTLDDFYEALGEDDDDTKDDPEAKA